MALYFSRKGSEYILKNLKWNLQKTLAVICVTVVVGSVTILLAATGNVGAAAGVGSLIPAFA